MNLMLPLMPEFGTMKNAEQLQVLLNLSNVESNSPLLGLTCKHGKIVIPLIKV